MSEITLPPEVASGFVDGVYALLVTDTGDADRLRNARAATEVTVTLTPKALRHVAGTPPMTILKRPVDLIIGSDGHIREKGAPASQDGPGVWVAVGVYRVAFSGTLSANLPQAFDIEVTEDHTEETPLWLSSAEHPVPAPGTPVTVLEVTGSPVPGYVVGVDKNGVLTYVEQTGGSGGTDLTTYSQVSSLPDYPDAFPADLSAQTDLQAALDGKQDAGDYAPATHNHDGTYATNAHGHGIDDVENLADALASKADSTHTHPQQVVDYDHAAPGSTFTLLYDNGWPSVRPTNRADVLFRCLLGDTEPAWMLTGDTWQGGTTSTPVTLAAPTNVAAELFETNRVRVTSDAVPGADEYHWAVTSETGETLDPVETTTVPLRESGPLEAMTHTYWVRASKTGGQQMSQPSTEVSIDVPTPTTPTGALALAMTEGAVSPNLINGRWTDTQWTGIKPTHSAGLFTASRPALTGSAQWRSETYCAGDDYASTSGRVQLQRYERFVMEFEVNLASGFTTNDNDSHDVLAQLIGKTTGGFWPGPSMAFTYQNGTFRVMNNPAPFGPVQEMTSVNGSGVAGRLNLGAGNTIEQWNHFMISVYLDGPGQGTIDMWANGDHFCQGWKPTAGTWYVDPSYTHEFMFPKVGIYGAAGGARPAKTAQHRNLRMSRHQGENVTTQKSAPIA